MRQYVLDELRLGDHKKLKDHLDENFTATPIDGLYWLKIPSRRLTATQRQHSTCQPFYFAIELCENALWVELLVRSQQHIRCDCITYASVDQLRWLVDRIDAILTNLEIQI
jgi:hypothetical protein